MIPENQDSSRIAYIDNIRSLVIVLVVMMHAAVTYSGLGSWYYVENREIGFISRVVFGFFQSHLQAFFMGLLFMIAGYFAASSLTNRGRAGFLRARLIRLGIPTLIYIVLLHPLSVKLIHPEMNLVNNYIGGLKSLEIFAWTGPMWFAAALLIFSILYALFRKWGPSLVIRASLSHIAIIILVITLGAFFLRLFFPLGTAVVNFQLGYFSSYIVLFILGILAFHNNLFQSVDLKMGRKLFLLAAVIGIPLWVFVMILGGPAKGQFPINGGFNWQALAYALWESLACMCISFGLVGIFRERLNTKTPFRQFLADNAFAVYVFHPPILIGLSVMLATVSMAPLLKFLFISALAIPACFIISSFIRKVPLFRRIFS